MSEFFSLSKLPEIQEAVAQMKIGSVTYSFKSTSDRKNLLLHISGVTNSSKKTKAGYSRALPLNKYFLLKEDTAKDIEKREYES
jgi:hypothetical protein